MASRAHIKQIIQSDPELNVIGEARDGEEAVLMAEKKRPDVIIMDILMPGLNGYEATRAIMGKCPAPIVINSALATPGQTEIVFQAMKAGAVAVCQKPPGPGRPDSGQLVDKLLRTTKLMSEVKVVRLLYPKKKFSASDFTHDVSFRPVDSPVDIIAIGASTGGPVVLNTILSNLNKKFAIPIIVVQHIASGFLEGMIEWLSKETSLTLKILKSGDRISSGHVYFTPEDHLTDVTPSRNLMIRRVNPGAVMKRPINHLFRSIAKAYGKNSMGILLTGMGNDGAEGLMEMKAKGAVTIAQSKESSVVFGMPGEAIRLDAATYSASPSEIISLLNSLAEN
jgi:two-component system chemotaxis response regulator CheB